MSLPGVSQRAFLVCALAVVECLLSSACRSAKVHVQPAIEFSQVPSFAPGNPATLQNVAGRVHGVASGDRIVLFARSGVWWVQPVANQPFTEIQPDSTWKNQTHPGTAYAALLVDGSYRPPMTVKVLPDKGGSVRAVTTVEGDMPSLRTLQFSGYDWDILDYPSNRGGTLNFYDSANAWTDKLGFLHLRIARQGNRWTSAEVRLSRSLGYGSYRFVARDVYHLEPATVFSTLSWDDFGISHEMDIEVSRWGESEDKNAQFVIQPYVVPANTVRFNAPSGKIVFAMDWQPGRADFKAYRQSAADPITQHVFTSGVPAAGRERIHMALYVFDNSRNPLRHESEVVVEKFEFLP